MRKFNFFCLFPILLLFLNTKIQAQEYYHFIYIEHEIGNHKNLLCEKLKTLHEDAKETGDALIIYLSTGDQEQDFGLCSYTNLKDPFGNGQDTDDAFNSIIAMIQDSKSLPINAQADVNNVIKIMDAYNFVDENGELKYRKAEIDFYAGNRFWKLGFNNTVIAHLYSILGISEMPKNSVDFRVFVPKMDNKLKYPEGMPFGENNIDGINGNVKINKY